ncbi:unnamed protein product [Cuscuta europaea]|uniref:Uncharacterized protein n=1 Tax=Cuscuta europaea TaxID=41803 RepID=A0A9P1EDS8_CUSEU|nr:unnamed protein product [Cuscuta europaea]
MKPRITIKIFLFQSSYPYLQENWRVRNTVTAGSCGNHERICLLRCPITINESHCRVLNTNFQVKARVLLPAPLPRVVDQEGRRGSCFHSYLKVINSSWIFEQCFP